MVFRCGTRQPREIVMWLPAILVRVRAMIIFLSSGSARCAVEWFGVCFFFQAEDGIRDLTVTGVQTCALPIVLQRVVDAGVWIFHSSIARLWLVEDDGKHLVLRASAGAPSTVVGVTRLALGDGLVGTVAATRRPQTILDAQNDPRIRNVERLRAEGSVSVAGVPVMIGERVLGGLSTAVRERRDYGVEELELLQSLANHAAIAIDNARLFLEEKARRDQVTALLDINTKIGAEEPTDA